MRIVLLIFLASLPAAMLANTPVVGDEIAGDAVVLWKAVIKKVSNTGVDGVRIKAKLDFRGRTTEGNRIRGTGDLRFISEPGRVVVIGDVLRGNDSLRYWATVKSMMGEDLAMIEGTGVLYLVTTDQVIATEGAVHLKAALEVYNGE